MELVSIALTAATLFAVGAQAVFVQRQARTLVQATKLDHDRRRKQSTIEFWSRLSDDRHHFRTLLRQEFGDEELTTDQLQLLIDNRYTPSQQGRTAAALVSFLDGLERFCTGINSGVFDIDIADAMCGAAIVRAYEQYGSWTKGRRKALERPALYLEMETVAEEISRRRRMSSRVNPLEEPDPR